MSIVVKVLASIEVVVEANSPEEAEFEAIEAAFSEEIDCHKETINTELIVGESALEQAKRHCGIVLLNN